MARRTTARGRRWAYAGRTRVDSPSPRLTTADSPVHRNRFTAHLSRASCHRAWVDADKTDADTFAAHLLRRLW